MVPQVPWPHGAAAWLHSLRNLKNSAKLKRTGLIQASTATMSSARASRLHYAPLPPRGHCRQRARDASDAVVYFARQLTNAGPVSRGHFGSKLRRRALLLGTGPTRRRRRRDRAAVVVSAAARRAELSTWRETGPLRGAWTSYVAATVGESTRRSRGAARRGAALEPTGALVDICRAPIPGLVGEIGAIVDATRDNLWLRMPCDALVRLPRRGSVVALRVGARSGVSGAGPARLVDASLGSCQVLI